METTEQTKEETTGTGLAQEDFQEGEQQTTPETEPETLAENQDNRTEFFGAPENYDFANIQMPEGCKLDTALAEKFAPIGKKLNLSQQGVNELANFFIEYQQQRLAGADEKIAEFRKQELDSAKLKYEQMLNTDKEIGAGDKTKMNAYIDVADVGYNSFASDELKEVLHNLHLDYHPAVIKHFHRLGKLCGNDSVNISNNPVGKESREDILYPTMA